MTQGSAPVKLSLLGTFAGCSPTDGGCGATGQYDDFAIPANARIAAGQAATLALDRAVYEKLVPLAFPAWSTGSSSNQRPWPQLRMLRWCR